MNNNQTELKAKDYRYFARLMALKQQLDPARALPEKPEYISETFGDIPNKYIDIKVVPNRATTPISVDSTWGSEWLRAFYKSMKVTESERPNLERELNSYFPDQSRNEKALCTLSVRSALDLYLQVRQFPQGSEILMTGMNIPDMVKIIEEHGCVPIPVEIALNNLQPSVEDIKRSVTSKTKAIIVAYVYGVTYDCSYIAKALEGTNIEILEDCAQSFRSVYSFRGNPQAVMSMFSFGTIKHNATGAGAVTVIRKGAEKHVTDSVQLHDKMKSL